MLEGEVLPYSDSSFDAIVACAVFTCITSQATRDNQFGELCRVLKTEGLLHMVEFCSEPSKSFTASIGIPMVYSTPLELRNLAHALQLVSEKVFNTSTMGGHQVYGYSLFAKKTLNKNSQQDAAKDVAPLL
jgi:ubiquinone/menaquinone biosynthesis C-methylase UbiE